MLTVIEQNAMQAVVSIPHLLREANEIQKCRSRANGGNRALHEQRLAENIFSSAVLTEDDDETMKTKAGHSVRAAKIFFDAWLGTNPENKEDR